MNPQSELKKFLSQWRIEDGGPLVMGKTTKNFKRDFRLKWITRVGAEDYEFAVTLNTLIQDSLLKLVEPR